VPARVGAAEGWRRGRPRFAESDSRGERDNGQSTVVLVASDKHARMPLAAMSMSKATKWGPYSQDVDSGRTVRSQALSDHRPIRVGSLDRRRCEQRRWRQYVGRTATWPGVPSILNTARPLRRERVRTSMMREKDNRGTSTARSTVRSAGPSNVNSPARRCRKDRESRSVVP
jgi:hypothetical protein